MVYSREDEISQEILKDHIQRKFIGHSFAEEQQWRSLPEIPTKSELIPEEKKPKDTDRSKERWNDYMDDPEYDENIPHNIVDGPWPSGLDYLGTHYQLLREDGIANLRRSIKEFRHDPSMNDSRETCVYTNVHIKGLHLGATGAAFRIEFSHDRAGKRIRWEQSKRLQQGSMVALTPENRSFEKGCKIAIVAARPVIGGLDQNPPQIDLFWGDNNDFAIDPAQSYVMIEARTGYFEAYRHMLVALQKLTTERFSLAKHIVTLEKDIQPPEYLVEYPYMNLNGLVRSNTNADPTSIPKESLLHNVNVLEDFPEIPSSGMDKSQMQACKRMLTSKVAIVQGPPGTGKTFTSVSAIRVLLDSMGPDDPPLIISAQTNHALDQLMKHVMEFEENVARLGGRTAKENKAILERTLYHLRINNPGFAAGARGLRQCRAELQAKIIEIQTAIAPLLSPSLITDDLLIEYGIINQDQKESLYEDGWDDPVNGTSNNGILGWLPPDQIRAVPKTPPINLGLPLEEMDLEYEQLQGQAEEEELDGHAAENDIDAMQGTTIPFQRIWTGKASSLWDERKILKELSKSSDLYKISAAHRGAVYRHFERMVDNKILTKLKGLLEEYQKIVENTKITKWLCNIRLMRHLGIKVVGCTTTGLSKYRGLLAALQPRTLLVEEAAETLEGNVIAGMFDSIQHLILVGDHQQLQAHTNVMRLEHAPYHLAVSMFERLVNNSVGFTMLNQQRRMIPEVRQLLCIEPSPFYHNLHDHPSVLDRVQNRPHVPGMGGRDAYFFHHNWPEAVNSDLSRYNLDEAEMIAQFFNYLVLNGTPPSKITVLTFYNGQRKVVLQELKKHPNLSAHAYFNVFTVDSYQGEENDVILLSLVRSNSFRNIGFLESQNRLVVALSRARRGLYIFGNAVTLSHSEASEDKIGRDPLWTPLLSHMSRKHQFNIDEGLPITCLKHGKTMFIKDADHFSNLAGGCDQKCHGFLPCGHDCTYTCHIFDHDDVICQKACPNILACGHGCSSFCGDACSCLECFPSPSKATKFSTPVVDWREYEDISKSTLIIPKIQHNRSESESESPRNVRNFVSDDVRNEKGQSFRNPPPRYATRIGPGHNAGGARNSSFGNPHFQSPNTEPRNPSPGSARQWQNFDAKKSDKALANKVLLEANTAPEFDPHCQIFHEKFLKVTVKNGVREMSNITRRVISGTQNDENREKLPHSVKSTQTTKTKPDDISGLELSVKPPLETRALAEDVFGPISSVKPHAKTETLTDVLMDFSEGSGFPTRPPPMANTVAENNLDSRKGGSSIFTTTLPARNAVPDYFSGSLHGITEDLVGLDFGGPVQPEAGHPVIKVAGDEKIVDEESDDESLIVF